MEETFATVATDETPTLGDTSEEGQQPDTQSEEGTAETPEQTETAGAPESEEPATQEQTPEDLVESLKQSLRAVTQERSRLLAENRQLREQLQPNLAPETQPEPQKPSEEALSTRGLKKITRLQDELLEGLWYDPGDDTVCVGNPDNLAHWVAPDVAREVVKSRRLEAERVRLEQERQAAQIENNLREVVERYENAARQMRERLLPNITSDMGKQIADMVIMAETARRMGAEGITQAHLAALDPNALERASDILHSVVTDIRDHLVAEISRAENQNIARAARSEPVPSDGGSAAVERDKPAGEMTPAEHTNYIVESFRRFVSRR